MQPSDPAGARRDLPRNVITVDPTDDLCTIDACPAVAGNVIVDLDKHHLTATCAMTLEPMLAAAIPADPVATIRARGSSAAASL